MTGIIGRKYSLHKEKVIWKEEIIFTDSICRF